MDYSRYKTKFERVDHKFIGIHVFKKDEWYKLVVHIEHWWLGTAYLHELRFK